MANQGRPKIKWARWTIGGMVFVAAAVVLWLLFAPRPVSVEVQPVQVGPLAESVADQGYARVREAYVVSAPVSGRLERLDLHVGDRVQAEMGIAEDVRRTLESYGHRIDVAERPTSDLGGAQIIVIDPASGVRITGADPRREAYAIAW